MYEESLPFEMQVKLLKHLLNIIYELVIDFN